MGNSNNLKILIVDDNPDIHRDFIDILTPKTQNNEARILEELIFQSENKNEISSLPSFHFDTAIQGEEGIERVKDAIEKGEPYALAFVDVRMPPGLDGIETIKEIWKLSPDIQTVICTAFSDY